MPDRYTSVHGLVVVGEVISPDVARPNSRIASCEVNLPGSENSVLIDIYCWCDQLPEAMSVANVVGDLYCPADGEPVIFAEVFTVVGPHADLGDRVAVGTLNVLAVGVVKAVSTGGQDTTLETEVYHRQNRTRALFEVVARRPSNTSRFNNTPAPAIGSVLLVRGTLSHFNIDGLAVIVMNSLTYFSFQPPCARKSVRTPGNGKRKLDMAGCPSLSTAVKKTRPDSPPFGKKASTST